MATGILGTGETLGRGALLRYLLRVLWNPSCPNFDLVDGDLTQRMAALGMRDFHSVARWVHALPYGRNTERSDYSLVLHERRGTCSTKHALLAAVARDANIAVHLRAGIFLMDEANTPGVGEALRVHDLPRVPEAHCVLTFNRTLIDLTFPGTNGQCALTFVVERDIRPEEIGAEKRDWHQAFVAQWARSQGLDQNAVWAAREACIAALGDRERTDS